jgi:hypothetical protein
MICDFYYSCLKNSLYIIYFCFVFNIISGNSFYVNCLFFILYLMYTYIYFHMCVYIVSIDEVVSCYDERTAAELGCIRDGKGGLKLLKQYSTS